MDESRPRVAVWCEGEEWCPLTSTATLIGKKWHCVIIHRLLVNGPLGFNALKEEVDGISSKVLSDALDDLEEKQLVNREIVNEKPVRVEYSLTDLGESLESIVMEMRDWGLEYLEPASDKDSSIA
ncbi:winged helix-turn-helix transcriptional regulator [Natribaculum luteum]|uniref:Winged helix-turn-helix transcriptional regulator n=1 Tax=Natribaculum luteum TaxID=1586232 RepID=A0ABD5P5H8_9EURY|nr:helix-turn-helix domain-containing protein [Natribaculum luteum]